MGRSDPGPQKYKESNQVDNRFHQEVSHSNKYWTDILLKTKSKDIVQRYNTTPGDKFVSRNPPDKVNKFSRSKSVQDCSIPHYEYYLRHNLYIKSAVENQNVLNLPVKNVSFRNYTPKILSQQVNMGMWI